MVGVSKRTGRVWGNGRTWSSGRNEKPLVSWYRKDIPVLQQLDSYFLSQDERITIADSSYQVNTHQVAMLVHRSSSTISRWIRKNKNE